MTPAGASVGRTAAVVLAGGTAARLEGADKASVEVDGRTLLEHTLAATAACDEVVLVGDERPTSRPVTFTREDPPGGGPAAGLLAGLDALAVTPEVVVVLAVDMPRVTSATLTRLLGALLAPSAEAGVDGAVLVDGAGRRQPLCAAYRTSALRAARPAAAEDRHDLPVWRLLAPLTLVEVAERDGEARDVDTWADLRDLRTDP